MYPHRREVDSGNGDQAIRMLKAARDTDWYKWVLALHEGRHVHGMRYEKGFAACPVRGCDGRDLL